jgi:hypothetical protein
MGDYLFDLSNQIKIGLSNYLFGQVDLIISFLQSSPRILSNSTK